MRMKCITCKDKKEKTIEQETKKIEKYVVPIHRKEQKLADERHKREDEMFHVCKKEVIRLPSPLSVATTSGKIIEFSSAYKKGKVVPEKISMTESTMKWPPEPTLEELKTKAPKSRIYINKTKKEKKPDKQAAVDSVDFIYNETYRQTHPWFVMYRGPDNSLVELKEEDYEEEEEQEEENYEEKGYEAEDYVEEENINDYEPVMPEQDKLNDNIIDENEHEEKQEEQEREKEEMTEATSDYISKLSAATSVDSQYKLKYASNVDLDTGIEPAVIHKILQKYQRESEMKLAIKTKMPFKRGTLKSHSTSKLPKEPKSFYFGVKTGTIHFGDVIFSERSRYRQGLPITVCAYTFSFMKHPSKWTSRDIDKVLEKGDKLYLESLDKRHVHDQSRVLQPEELSNVVIFGEKKIKYKIDEPDIAGFIKSEDPKVFNLLKEPRTQELYTTENGIAVLATFYDIPSILVMLLDRGNLDNWPFIISKISIKKISSTTKPITDTDSISSDYTEDKLYRIINQEKAVLNGSICIEDECFGESKNRLGYASSIISLVYSHITPPSAWNKKTIDKILYVSNQFYLEWQKLYPEETMDLANIPAFFTVGPITFEIAIYANQYAGLMYQKQNCLFEELLVKFFSSNTSAIVQIDKYILAIWKNRDMYYTFDPYARDTEGFRSLAGTAAVNMNINISTLVQTVIRNFTVKTYIFKINILKVVKINRDPEFEKPPRGYFNSEASLLDTLPLTNKTITIDDTECAMRTTELDEPLGASLLEIGSYVGSLDMKYVTPVPRTLSKIVTKFTAPHPEKIYDLDSPSLSETQIDKAKPGPLRENSFEFRLLEEIKREEIEVDELGDLEEGVFDYVREIKSLEVTTIKTIMEMKDEITQQGKDYEIFYASAQVNTDLIGITPLPRVVLEPNKIPIGPTGRTPGHQDRIVCEEVPITQSQELAKDSNFILLPDGSEILYGAKNIAQLGEDFDVISPFVSIVAVIMAKKYTLNTWSKEVVDAILDYGAALQKNVDVKFPKVPKIKLPRIVIGCNAYTVTVDYMFDSLLESSILETCLEKLVFSNRESAIIVTDIYSCAVFLKRHLYYMFDGFGCNLVGFGSGPDNAGMACTFRFKTLHHLVSRFFYNKKQREIYEPTEAARFVISTVDIKTIWPESKEKIPRQHKLDQPQSRFESNPQSIHKGENGEEEPEKKQKNVVGYHTKGKYVVIEGSSGLGERTEDDGQVKPCHFINLCAMIGLLNRPIKSWDTKRVDYVLDMGQTLFNYIDNTNFAEKRNIQNLLLDKHFFDILVKRLDIQNPVNRKNLTVALNHLLKKNKYLLVQFPNCSFVLYDCGKNLHLFDPYGYKGEKAKASWIKMENTKSIVKYFKHRNLKENFYFYTVNISRIERASRKKQIEYRLRVTNVKKEKPVKKPKILHEDEDWLQVYPIPWSQMKNNLASGACRGHIANKWFNWDVEYPDDLYSLTGTIHQTSCEFSKKSRGKQTIANCIVSVVMTEMYDFTEWNPEILDSIVRFGDKYFHECFKGQREKNYEIKVEDFKSELSVFPYNVCVDILPLIEGTMFLQKAKQFNLSKALRYFFEEYENRCGIICCSNEQCKTKYLTFGRIRNGEYFMYDCQTIGPPMFVDKCQSKSYILRCLSLNRLLHCLTLTLRCGDFFIYSVGVAGSQNEEKEIRVVVYEKDAKEEVQATAPEKSDMQIGVRSEDAVSGRRVGDETVPGDWSRESSGIQVFLIRHGSLDRNVVIIV
ncbi:uncharacterized protein CBL_02265 [Carabus blaptoides fortunei]